MTARTTPPFRADHVGSLLRPAELHEARGRAGFVAPSPPVVEDAMCAPSSVSGRSAAPPR